MENGGDMQLYGALDVFASKGHMGWTARAGLDGLTELTAAFRIIATNRTYLASIAFDYCWRNYLSTSLQGLFFQQMHPRRLDIMRSIVQGRMVTDLEHVLSFDNHRDHALWLWALATQEHDAEWHRALDDAWSQSKGKGKVGSLSAADIARLIILSKSPGIRIQAWARRLASSLASGRGDSTALRALAPYCDVSELAEPCGCPEILEFSGDRMWERAWCHYFSRAYGEECGTEMFEVIDNVERQGVRTIEQVVALGHLFPMVNTKDKIRILSLVPEAGLDIFTLMPCWTRNKPRKRLTIVPLLKHHGQAHRALGFSLLSTTQEIIGHRNYCNLQLVKV